MRFIAQELREIMAQLGFKTIDEMCGHTECLKIKDGKAFERAELLDMSRILAGSETAHFVASDVYDFHLDQTIDEKTLLPEFEKIKKEKGKTASFKKSVCVTVSSTDRTVGTILGSEIQKAYGSALAEDSFTVHCKGGGGQSFGAFIPHGLTLRLEGDANDYLGKGLSGGKIVVRIPHNAKYKAENNIIIGNVALFGATSGEAYINGIAGERFCVRNSGATAVVEGCGDHGLEYMTGGVAVILGSTGRNFAAGMSGGTAYVLDEKHQLYKNLNEELVDMTELSDKHDKSLLKAIIEKHVSETGSELGKKILEDWERYSQCFKKIVPRDYNKMLALIAEAESRGLNHDEARLEAFKKFTAA